MERRVEYRNLGVMPYGECWRLQEELFGTLLNHKKGATKGASLMGEGATKGAPLTEKGATEADAGYILAVEHPAVYTLGKSGKSSNILFSEEQLASIGAEFFHIDRGGDITFHGEGQIVLYPILDLERVGIGLKEYISALEQAVIETVAHWGIEAVRIAGAAGVWIEKGASRNKICAIGVRSSRYVTMHGLALNVKTDLKYFNYINPCGFTDRGVTSLERECATSVDLEQVKELLLNNLIKIINVKIYKK